MVVIKCNFIKFHLHEFFLPCYGQNYLSYRLFLYWLLKMLRILFSRLDFLIANTFRTILLTNRKYKSQLVEHWLLGLDQRPSVDLSEDYLYCFHSLQMAQNTLLIFSRSEGKTGANVRFRAYEGHWHVLLGFAPLYHSLAWWDTRRGQKMGRAPFLAHNPPCPGSISSAYYALPPTTLVIIIICPPGGLKIADKYKIFAGLGMILLPRYYPEGTQ